MSECMTRRRFICMTGLLAAGVACVGCAAATAQGAPSATAPSAGSGNATLQRACPKGIVNDPYPGRCRDYRDDDHDGYCDYSVSA